MADLFEDVEALEGLAMLAGIGILAYLGWKVYEYFQTDPAAKSAASDPVGAVKTILGFGQGTTSVSKGQIVAGTREADSSGQQYRCNGTDCYPINVDTNGNETVSGPPVSQGSLTNVPALVGSMSAGDCPWWDVLC